MKKAKHIIVMVTMAVLLILETVFLVYGYRRIETGYVESYLEQQEQYVEQVGIHLEYILAQGGRESELISYMAENVPASGSYYGWLIQDENVIFAKNETVTEALGELQSWPVFQQVVEEGENCSVSAEFSCDGKKYILGVVTDREYILDNKELQTFKIYGAVSLSILGLSLFAALLIYIQEYMQKEQRNLLLEKELQNKNSVLDEVNEEAERLNWELQKYKLGRPREKRDSYDLQIARKLLEKSEREDVQPVYYATVELQMDEERYYAKQQILEAVGKIPLDSRHVRMELSKGCFLIMFYRTGRTELAEILKTVKKTWKADKITMKVHTGTIKSGTKERRWLDLFLEGKGDET